MISVERAIFRVRNELELKLLVDKNRFFIYYSYQDLNLFNGSLIGRIIRI